MENRFLSALASFAMCGAIFAAVPVVVIPDKPTAVEKSAAKELSEELGKCLGEKPDVFAEGALDDGTGDSASCRQCGAARLFVGATKAAKKARAADERPYQVDEVFLKSVDGGVVMDGDPARAPLYAVDLYLEKYCGVRWWTSDAATYPKLDAAPVKDISLSYAPQFKYRETYYLDGFDPLFKVRSKGNFTSLTRYLLTDIKFIPPELGGNHRLYFFKGRHSAYHSFFEILPPTVYFEKHPEWYSLVKGKREPKQLCLANEEMKAEYIKETLKRLREDSSVDFIQVSQNDWRGYCTCEKCKAMMDEDGGAPSGPYLRFANDVAEAVEKEFPNVRIDTFAYQFTRRAPTKTKPRHNVVVRLCDIECDFARPLNKPLPPHKATFAKDLADWRRVAGGNLFIWDYLANFHSYMMPHPNINSIAPNIRLFAENGAVGVFEQGDALCSAGTFATLRHYVTAHLLWDPKDDEKRLMDEFMEGYYGKSAAPFLKKFIAVIEAGPRKTKQIVKCGHKGAPFLPGGDKLLAAKYMDEAVAAASKDGEPFASRVRRERLTVDHMLLLNYDILRNLAAKRKMPWTRPATKAEAVENWIRDVKSFGVKARRETTRADEIENYFNSLRKGAKPAVSAKAKLGGGSLPVVVLPDSPTAVEKSAAEELAGELGKCLGDKPKVVAEATLAKDATAARLFVGATKAAKVARADGSASRPYQVDEVFLKSVEGGVVLDGDPARAPLYAVDLYLEKYCGVRWWTSDAATYPKLDAVPVKDISLSYAPQFKYRETYYLDGFDPLFKVRSKGNFTSVTRNNQLTGVTFIPPALGGNHRLFFFKGRHSAYHSFFEILPPKVYFEKHPEWYSLVDGRRQPKQLCVANEEMKTEYIKKTLKCLRTDPAVDFIQVSQNDRHDYCTCEKCMAMMEEDGGAPSGPYLRFVNDVAEAVEKEFPNVRVDTFAYQFTRRAPTKTRPRPNVVVRLCDIESDFSRPLDRPLDPLKATFAKDLADWHRVAGGNLFIWDYLANFKNYMMPHPNIGSIAPNIRLFAENGAVGVFEQGDAICSAGSFATLRHYVASHLLWDPKDDDRRLMDEFLDGYYGRSAAPFLKEFIAVIDAGPIKTKQTVRCFRKDTSFLGGDDKLKAARLMDEAAAAAEKEGEPFASRVRRERLSVDHMLLLNYDILRNRSAKLGFKWTRPATKAEAVENWIRDVKSFGVKARRETTRADEIEKYFNSLRK